MLCPQIGKHGGRKVERHVNSLPLAIKRVCACAMES